MYHFVLYDSAILFFSFAAHYKEKKREEKRREEQDILVALRSARMPFCPQLGKKKRKKKEQDEGNKNEQWLTDILH